jgi:hypothetical protein
MCMATSFRHKSKVFNNFHVRDIGSVYLLESIFFLKSEFQKSELFSDVR